MSILEEYVAFNMVILDKRAWANSRLDTTERHICNKQYRFAQLSGQVW